jgi:C4-type Zn-finger protein
MSEYRFHLQKYRPGSKTTCPSCGKSRCFVRYIDEQGSISFPGNVGKCDHENSCGYHYTPKEYFKDNPDVLEMDEGSGKSLLSVPYKKADKTLSCIVPSYIPSSYVLTILIPKRKR